MAVVTHDEILTDKKSGKKRRKGQAALKKLRRALARRKLEMMREDAQLKEDLYDVFEDEE